MFSFCLKDQNDETNRTQKHTNCIFEAHRKSTAAKQRKTSKDTKKTAAYILIRAAAFISLP
jgi:hypothetical protein